MILYESNETEFKSQGICNLNASLNWYVTEAINSTYELEMEYPIDGKYFNEIKFRRIIYAKPSPHALPQPFRIYDITTSINRTILVNAAHISYDLSGYPVEPFTANSALNAITELKKHVVPECPFVFKTDITEPGEIRVTMPKSARSILGNSISTAYKPQFFFDHFTVDLKNSRGNDNGVEIRYSKNMLDMKQEENISNVYTAVYPFWKSDEEGLVVLPEKTISTPGTYNYTKIYILDLSNEYTEKPTLDQIREKTNNYIESEKLGIPKVSLTLSFVQLSTSTEYAQYGLLDKIDLGDTVKVVFEEAGVETTAKCVKTIYNGKTNRYDTIEIGEAVKTLADGLVSSTEDVYNSIDTDKENTKSYFEKALEEITNAITGNSGGYVRFNPPKNPSEILIMDTEDMNTATIVWRWNKSGLGVSRTGYNGPYVGIGQNGRLVIDEATANKISAGIIEGGLLKSFNGLSWIDMTTGTFNLANRIKFDGVNFNIDLSGENLVEGDKVISSINNTTETVRIKADKIQLEGSTTIAGASGDRVRINNANYEILNNDISKAFFGLKEVDDNRLVPRLALSHSGLNQLINNYFVMTAHDRTNNPLGTSSSYLDLAYRSQEFKLTDNTGDVSNIRMISNGDIQLAAIREVIIRSNYKNGNYTNDGAEYNIAKFSTSGSDYFDGNLQIDCVRNIVDRENGLVLADYGKGADNATVIRISTDSTGTKFVRPVDTKQDIRLGSPTNAWYNIYTAAGAYSSEGIISSDVTTYEIDNTPTKNDDVLDEINFFETKTLSGENASSLKMDVTGIIDTCYVEKESDETYINVHEMVKLLIYEVKKLKDENKELREMVNKKDGVI